MGPFYSRIKNGLTLTWSNSLLSRLERRFFIYRYTLSPLFSRGAVFRFLLTYKMVRCYAYLIYKRSSSWTYFSSSTITMAFYIFIIGIVLLKRYRCRP
jgi:hypothetical protein